MVLNHLSLTKLLKSKLKLSHRRHKRLLWYRKLRKQLNLVTLKRANLYLRQKRMRVLLPLPSKDRQLIGNLRLVRK